MDGPASSVTRALNATFATLARGATQWVPLALVLGWLAALPGALAERMVPEYVGYVLQPWGVDPNALMALLIVALVVLLVQITVELVALALLYIIAADLVAGRPLDLLAGLRRTLAWRLQVSWLVSSVLYSTATRLWFLGGCLLFVPYGFAVPDAYEQGSGLGAFGRARRLGNLRIGGGRGPQPGWTLAGASTVLLLLFAVLSVGLSIVSSFLAPTVDVAEIAGRAMSLDPTRPEGVVELMKLAIPSPTWLQTAWAILQGPYSILREFVVLTVGMVVYHDALKHDPTPGT